MSKRILLADDSVTIQKVIELTLSAPGFEVISVGSGDDALEKLASGPLDLVIADVHMPGASGFEVARRVKQLHADLPVLLLVGTFEPFDPEEAAASGADGHMKKPFDAEELRKLVKGWLAAAPDRRAEAVAEPEADEESGEEAASEAGVGGQVPPAAASATVPGEVTLSEEQIESIAKRVAEMLGEEVLRDVSWEVVPDLAEMVIKERLRELESQVEPADS